MFVIKVSNGWVTNRQPQGITWCGLDTVTSSWWDKAWFKRSLGLGVSISKECWWLVLLGFKWGLVLIKVLVGLGNEATVGWLPFLSCRLLSFGSFTSFTRLFIARPKGLALGYSFASLSHILSLSIASLLVSYSFLHYRSVSHRSLSFKRSLTIRSFTIIAYSLRS